jgi:hypothetical protein
MGFPILLAGVAFGALGVVALNNRVKIIKVVRQSAIKASKKAKEELQKVVQQKTRRPTKSGSDKSAPKRTKTEKQK